jgi:hypothetical protein
MAQLLDIEAVRERLRRRFGRQRGDWLTGQGDWPWEIPLGVPTEKTALANLEAVRHWAEAWRTWEGPGELRWVERRWPRAGSQRLPGWLVLEGPQQVADWLGEGPAWRQARQRHAALCRDFPALSVALGRYYEWLAGATDADFQRLRALLHWLVDHPGSGLYLRQLPIAGLDSKWAEAQGRRLTSLLRALRGAEEGDFWKLAGLRREPALLRLRLLDPELCARVGGLSDVSAPADEIARLPLHPRVVFIVENLRTGLAFQTLPGAVVFMAQGYAVDAYGGIPWLRDRPVHYWGDIDTHGFQILDRLRHHLPAARSLLMDEATLLAHRELWSREDRPAAAHRLDHLTPEEQALYGRLQARYWRAGVRLEQERIGWDYVWERILEAARDR